MAFDVTSRLLLAQPQTEPLAETATSEQKPDDIDDVDDDQLLNPSMFASKPGGDDAGEGGGGGRKRAPRLSKRQRRNMKKTGDPNEAPERSQPASKPKPKPKPETTAPAPLPRGKRTKLKRMKEKYGDQDAEEMALRAMLLGTTIPAEVAEEMGIVKSEEEEEIANEEEVQDGVDQDGDGTDQAAASDWIVKRCFHCHEVGHVIRECPQLVGADKQEITKAIAAGQDRLRQVRHHHQLHHKLPTLRFRICSGGGRGNS